MKIIFIPTPIDRIEFYLGKLNIHLKLPIQTSFNFGYYIEGHRVTPSADFWMRLQFPILIFWGSAFPETCIDDDEDDDDFYDREEFIDEEEYYY